MRTVTALFVVGLAAGALPAQEKKTDHTFALNDGGKPAAGTLADVAWLAGHWTGPGLGGQCEEIWVAPLAGCKEMMGMFRCVRDGTIVITEHMALVEADGSLALKIRHFDATFNAREDKDKPAVFKLVKLDKGVAYFDGLTIRKNDVGVSIYVAMKTKDGTVREMPFPFTKAAEAK
jgi:hypothetical protein